MIQGIFVVLPHPGTRLFRGGRTRHGLPKVRRRVRRFGQIGQRSMHADLFDLDDGPSLERDHVPIPIGHYQFVTLRGVRAFAQQRFAERLLYLRFSHPDDRLVAFDRLFHALAKFFALYQKARAREGPDGAG